MMEPRFKTATCCNPFNEENHGKCRKNLRNVVPWMLCKCSSLQINTKICDSCRKRLSKLEDDILEKSTTSSVDDDGIQAFAQLSALNSLNESLQSIGESPVKMKRLSESKYPKVKMSKIEKGIKEKMLSIPKETNAAVKSNPASEIIEQLKVKFLETKDRSTKVTILTLLPQSWSIRKIQFEFPTATNYMVRKAKALVKDHGILTSPNPKPGRLLSSTTEEAVISFYNSDDVSRIMPGKKDFVSIKVGVHAQKRLILSNLKEVYAHFKETYSDYHVGFSKFAALRPKNCVLAGESGTHAVCVCTIHQNVKLMLECSKLPELAKDRLCYKLTYQHCLSAMICNPPNIGCFFNECSECPGSSNIRKIIENVFEENSIAHVTFKQWISADRSVLETLVKNSEDFIETFIEKLITLIRHSFIATQQGNFLSDLKVNLQEGEFIVLCDFAENYSFILQDEVQGFHWNNAQATIHPFAFYFREHGSNVLQTGNLIVISDCMKHDTVAVYTFQKCLINFIREKTKSVKKIFYFSDGCAAQYKNRKNFLNLTHHEYDFQLAAEWHFFATSHGKSTCDGLGGTLKRLAARASLQRPYQDQIMTPRQLYDWAVSSLRGINFAFVSNEECKKQEMHLSDRFSASIPIAGTQKLHAYIPIEKGILKAKCYSTSQDSNDYYVSSDVDDSLPMSHIKGFVTCMYDSFWWVACVLSVDEDKDEVKLSFLHPHGPSPSYKYPAHFDILTVPRSAVLTTVDCLTATGRTYTLTAAESKYASEKLQKGK